MIRFKRWFCAFAAALLLASLPGAVSGEKLGSLRIRCLKIGKADAYLLLTESHSVLIDAGETRAMGPRDWRAALADAQGRVHRRITLRERALAT